MEENTTKPQAPDDGDQELVKKLEGQWQEAKKWASGWREEAREDRRFYDGDQWTDQQKRELEAQGRPATVINQIFKAVNNLVGRERDSRLDWKALPRGESDVLSADAMTKALKYVADQTRSRFAISRAFKDAVKGPVGWLEIGLDDSDPTKEPLFVRHVPWDEAYWDPFGKQPDMDDWRYFIRCRVVDTDLARKAFPGKEEALQLAEVNARKEQEYQNKILPDDYGNGYEIQDSGFLFDNEGRSRVRLREHWYWENEQGEFLVYPDGRVLDFDPQDPGFVLAIQEPGAQRRSGTKKCFYWAIVAGKTVLAKDKSPYPFARFPFVPLWSYVDEDGKPFGVIRMQKDPQRELNVARSRFNESIRSRWLLYKEGALGNISADQANRLLARSNFSLPVTDLGGVQMGSDKADGALYAELMQMSKAEIDDVPGMNEAAYGDKSNEKSGKAIQARVTQQGLNMGEIFDNLRFARLQVGEMLLALVQKFYPPEKLQRITEAAILRDGGQQDLAWLGQAFAGPIEQMRFDVVIDDQAENTTERQAAMAQAIELIGFLPDMAKAAIVPDIIRMSDFADKEQIAQKAEAALVPPALPQPPMDPTMGQPMMAQGGMMVG